MDMENIAKWLIYIGLGWLFVIGFMGLGVSVVAAWQSGWVPFVFAITCCVGLGMLLIGLLMVLYSNA